MEIINVSSDDESVNENCPIINQQEDFILDEHAAMFCFVYKYYYNKNPILQILFSNQTTKKKPKIMLTSSAPHASARPLSSRRTPKSRAPKPPKSRRAPSGSARTTNCSRRGAR